MTTREKILLGVLGVLLVGYFAVKKWELPKEAAPYVDEIRKAETANNIPHNLLGRLLWVESRFRPDIISGQKISSAGAIGIAQIVPKWHPDVDPRDPVASIRYAGQFLGKLKKQLGTWDKAVAAYNTGAGNVQKAIARASVSKLDWLSHVADETKNYVRDIITAMDFPRNV